MKVLLVGSGGREHAMAWALAQSPLHPTLYIAPGNPGTAQLGTNVPITVDQKQEAIAFARDEGIDLTIIGPEVPLVNGWTDAFREAGLRVFGPTAAAARIEGSKEFAKAFMSRHGIPTATHRTFSAAAYEEAKRYVSESACPIVLKADGLAAGKGVLICMNHQEALDGLEAILKDHRFGDAGASVVVEEFMEGEELSVFIMTDGERFVTLAPAQDHKRVGDGDTGLNTGGMGTYAPAPIATEAMMERIKEEITLPTLRGMVEEGHPYEGVLYMGLMITLEGPKVVEYNCRFGDPEAQVIIPLLQDDMLMLMVHLLEGKDIPGQSMKRGEAAACVIMASGGYPESYAKGVTIEGIEKAEGGDGVIVFQAGTTMSNGSLVTSGGRVLGVTATDCDLPHALERAYQAVSQIHFDGNHYRTDIGQKGLKYL